MFRGRWFDSAGRFLFSFLENVLFFGVQRAVARDLVVKAQTEAGPLVESKKRPMGTWPVVRVGQLPSH